MEDITTTIEREVPDSKTPKVTSDKLMLARVTAAELYMKPHVLKSTRAANRYLDSSARSLHRDTNYDTEIKELPVGEVNYLAMNIRQKVAGVAIGTPDILVKVKDEAPGEYAEIVRQYIRETWRKKQWGRIFRRVLTQRYVTGMGHLGYLWDRRRGFEIEYVETRDYAADPNTTQDTWDRPRWGYRYINVPIEVAYVRYGKDVMQYAAAQAEETLSPFKNVTKDKSVFRICLYYDETCEAELYGKVVLRKGPNFYNRVPIKSLVGDINPAGEFPLGDYDTSLGIFEMTRRLQNIINNTAQNGGGIPWLRTEFIDEKIRQKVINGTHNGYVLVTGVPGEQAVGYTANNPLSDAVLKALTMMGQGLDADQGVSEYDRGVVNTNPKFATQAALLANRAGSRGNLARIDYEDFVEDVLNEMVKLTAKFGLDPEAENSDEAQILWEACQAVTEIQVIEESSTFKDPGIVANQNLTLFQLAVEAFPVLAQTGTMLNLKSLFDDLLRAFDKRDTDKYYLGDQEILELQQRQMMQAMQQQGAPPGSEPGQPTADPNSPGAQESTGVNSATA